MSINRFVLRSSTFDEIVAMDLVGISSNSKYILRGATGLDSVETLPVGYSISLAGLRYYLMNPDKRVIVLNIELNPDHSIGETYKDLRDHVYKGIAANRSPECFFEMMDGTITHSYVKGFITRVEASYFTSTPGVQITLECEHALFKAAEEVEINPATFTAGSMFIEESFGTAPTGFEFRFTFTSTINGITISGDSGAWSFVIQNQILVGDELYVNSDPENRDVHILRSSNTIRIADRIAAGSIWPILFPGENLFNISATIGTYEIDSVKYRPRYWGL